LLEVLFDARAGFSWPTKFITAGLVGASAFEELVSRPEEEFEDNATESREQCSEIVDVASELARISHTSLGRLT